MWLRSRCSGTGGWDSTFRLLVVLLVERRAVQPYYIVDGLRYRPGVPEEQQAMGRIRELITRRHPQAASRLLPTIDCAVQAVPANAVLTAHSEGCLATGFIGGQYEWLARYCAAHGIDGMELAIHRDDNARELLAGLIDGSRVRVDPDVSGR